MMMLSALLMLGVSGGSRAQWTLATADTRAVIAVSNDRPEILSLGAVGEPTPWCKNSVMPLIDHDWQGREAVTAWHFVRGTVGERGARLNLEFRSADKALQLSSIWRARTGHGPIEHWVEITNRTTAPIAVPRQQSLSLSGLRPNGSANVWWVRRGASNALTEGGVFQTPVKPGMNLALDSDHHNPSSPVPWLAVQVGRQRGLYVGWEFSGLGRVRAQSASPGSLNVTAGLLPDFKTDILPGETLKIPAAFVGCYRGDIDEGAYCLQQFVSQKLRAPTPKGFPNPPLILGLYLDAGADHAKEGDVLRCERFAKSIGFEVFMPDAMWFPACGDWRWDPARFPRGAGPIERAVHGDRMKFGLWCAWDNGGVSSDPGALSVRGPVGHPDWFPFDLPANWQPGPFYGASACMGSEAAKQWAIKKTQSLVGNLNLDMLKTDCNPMIAECTRTDHRHKYGTDVSYWSALGVYEVWDKLRARYPRVVLENCSGASHIKDFGVVRRCAYTTVTDTLSNLPDRAGIYDSTFVLPPSALLTYTYENGYGLPGDDPGPYLARSAMMTAWNMAPTNSKGWTAEEKASIIGCVRDYKEWIRPIIRDCKVHHILPRPDGKHWDGMFFWSAKLGHGACFVFRPDSPNARHKVRLAGLEAATRYRLWCDDGSITPYETTGAELMRDGIGVRLASHYTSDLIHIEQARLPNPAGRSTRAPAPAAVGASVGDYFGVRTTFSWKPTARARCYHVVVSQNKDMSMPVLDRVVYADGVESRALPTATDLYWRVDGLAWGGVSIGKVHRLHSAMPTQWGGHFVSDLPWVKALAGVPEGPHRDVNHYGNVLAIAGTKYPKGIWTHSFDNGDPADIVIDIAGKGYGTFAADVGLDDASGGGSVQFQVLLDGKVVAETKVLRPGQMSPMTVRLAAARLLTLRVLNGGDGYTSDHAVWGLARVIRAGALDPFAVWPPRAEPPVDETR
ncbi:MAG: NPCBM/NEW2 domain-containing protein [Fimbriimonadaceae bacterium]